MNASVVQARCWTPRSGYHLWSGKPFKVLPHISLVFFLRTNSTTDTATVKRRQILQCWHKIRTGGAASNCGGPTARKIQGGPHGPTAAEIDGRFIETVHQDMQNAQYDSIAAYHHYSEQITSYLIMIYQCVGLCLLTKHMQRL